KIVVNSHSQPVLERPRAGREASPAIGYASLLGGSLAATRPTAQAGHSWPHSAYRPNSSDLYPSALPVRAGAAALCPGRPARRGPAPSLARPFPYRFPALCPLPADLLVWPGASFAAGALSAAPRTGGMLRLSAVVVWAASEYGSRRPIRFGQPPRSPPRLRPGRRQRRCSG